MNRSSALVALAAVLLTSLAAVASRPAPPRVAYVSVQRVLAQSTAATAAGQKIQAFREQRGKEIAAKQKAIEDLRLQVAQSGGMFQGSKRTEARQQEAKAVAELQQLERDSQTQLQNMQRDGQREFQQDVAAVVGEFAKERGADLVLNEDTAVVYRQPGTDWTDDVVKAVNARHTK
jgi:Skp family chaperone for outer membrane proteins